MKKKIGILFTLCIMTAALVLPTGCKIRNKVPDNEYTLEISSFKGGYGQDWLKKMGEAFEAKNPECDVVVSEILSGTNANNDFATMLMAGPSGNTADLIITENEFVMSYIDKKDEEGEYYIEELTDVYDIVVEGKTKSIKERMSPSILDTYNYNGTGRFYAFPHKSDVLGMMYNEKMFRENGWNVPLTTNGLVSLAQQIKDANKNIYPFVWPSGYWGFLTPIWWAQYDGLETYQSFYHPRSDMKATDSDFIFKQQGRLESQKVLESLTARNTGYSAPGCLTSEFSELQGEFAVFERVAMMPNGGWLEKEMQGDLSKNIRMMKAPVISALGTKLGITEAELIEAIKYADGTVSTVPTYAKVASGYTAETVTAEIVAARTLNSTSVSYSSVSVIPKYSNAKEWAKKFLAFMTTDEAMEIGFKEAGLLPLIDEDVDVVANVEASDFIKSKLAVFNASNGNRVQMRDLSHPLFYWVQIYPYSVNLNPEAAYHAQNPSDRKTAQEVINLELVKANQNWNDWMTLVKNVVIRQD